VKFDNFQNQVEDSLREIEQNNPYNAFISTLDNCDEYLQELQKDPDYQEKDLAGLTLGIKDNINIAGYPVTCASDILEGYTASYDATVIKKIKEAGGLILGKTNMDEFAMGSSSEHSAYGPVENPVDTDKVPGGSSGGSAAAVAAELVDIALGSDTGGSIRQPAAFCGVMGMKPTYGRVSRYGLVAYASSLDQIGPFARNLEDLSKLLQVISGSDKNDSTSVKKTVPDFSDYLNKDIEDKIIGLPEEYFKEGLETDIQEKVYEVVDELEQSGARIKEISLPHTSYAVAAYYILATAEASSNLARYDGIRYGLSEKQAGLEELYRDTRHSGFGDEVKRRIILGTYVLSAGYYEAYYDKAQRVRRLVKQDFNQAFDKVDLIFTPTTPTTAFDIGGMVEDPLAMYLNDVYTVPANLAGVPALNIPLGTDSKGLPIGGQLISDDFQESELIQAGHFIQREII